MKCTPARFAALLLGGGLILFAPPAPAEDPGGEVPVAAKPPGEIIAALSARQYDTAADRERAVVEAALCAAADRDSLFGEQGYYTEIRRVIDTDGSVPWWPYKTAKPGDVRRSYPGKAGWFAGVHSVLFMASPRSQTPPPIR